MPCKGARTPKTLTIGARLGAPSLALETPDARVNVSFMLAIFTRHGLPTREDLAGHENKAANII